MGVSLLLNGILKLQHAVESINAPKHDNVLLVAGTGRNTGKTSLVCAVCADMPAHLKPICMKISIHFHPQPNTVCHFSSAQCNIFEETEVTSDKDTARMLAAGASRVFFIEAEEAHIFNAFNEALKLFAPNTPIICESGGLRHYIRPSLFVMVHKNGTEPKPSAIGLMPMADHIFRFDEGKLNIPTDVITFDHHQWKLNT